MFCPGRGSYLTTDREVEMDASIMDGTTMKAGGVACVTNIMHPVKLSRLIMDQVRVRPEAETIYELRISTKCMANLTRSLHL